MALQTRVMVVIGTVAVALISGVSQASPKAAPDAECDFTLDSMCTVILPEICIPNDSCYPSSVDILGKERP